ncbi:hypothetical protein SGP16001_44250 [Shigella flexneri]|nr:hypothetical protein SGP16001_44250 [Shigella flexneri]GLG76812.1 hypothetical protein SGP16020_42440 [Shigella flexneri]
MDSKIKTIPPLYRNTTAEKRLKNFANSDVSTPLAGSIELLSVAPRWLSIMLPTA